LRTDREFGAREDRGRAGDTSGEAIAGKRGQFVAISRFERKRPMFNAQRPTLNSEGS